MTARYPDEIYQFSIFPFLKVKDIARLDRATKFLVLDPRAIGTTFSEYARTKRELIALRVNTPLTKWIIHRGIFLTEVAVRADYWGSDIMPVLVNVSRLYLAGTNYSDLESIIASCKKILHLHILLEIPHDLPFFAHIGSLCLALQSFELSDGGLFTDTLAAALTQCSHLESVCIAKAELISDAGIAQLVKRSPNLHTLQLTDNDNITDLSIMAIAEHSANLHTLKLSSAVELSNVTLINLFTRCPKLQSVALIEAEGLEDSGLDALAYHCPALTNLDISSAAQVSFHALLCLGRKLEHLHTLRVDNCRRLDHLAVASLLLSCPALREVSASKIPGIDKLTASGGLASMRVGKGWAAVRLLAEEESW
jgi:hypothetical protein